MLMSIRSAPASARDRGRRAHHLGVLAEELDRDRVLVGMQAQQLAQGALVAVVEAEAGDHLARPRGPAPWRRACRRTNQLPIPASGREQHAVGDLDVADAERGCQGGCIALGSRPAFSSWIRRSRAGSAAGRPRRSSRMRRDRRREPAGGDGGRPPRRAPRARRAVDPVHEAGEAVGEARLDRRHGVAADRRLRAARRRSAAASRCGRSAPPARSRPRARSRRPGTRPSAETTSKLVEVPKSTETQAPSTWSWAATALTRRSAPELVGVVDQDRHPRLQVRARPSGRRARCGARRGARTRARAAARRWRRSRRRARRSRGRRARAGCERRARARRRCARLRGQAPVVRELGPVEGADVGLGVADVDREQHAGDYRSTAARRQRDAERGSPLELSPARPAPSPASESAPARRVPSGRASSGSSSSSGTSTKRREVTSRWGSVSRSVSSSRSPSSSRSMSSGRGPWRGPAKSRPCSASIALQTSSSASGSSAVRIADHGVQEVGLVEDLADRLGLVERTRRPRPRRRARAGRRRRRRCRSRSPTFEPSPR